MTPKEQTEAELNRTVDEAAPNGGEGELPAGAPTEVGADQVERLLTDLNGPQREAVTFGEGPLLILAGAGSGKTRALTHRIAWLLATGRARPNQILAITFTNKAADEMRGRVSSLVGGVSRRMWVMTFHAACARLLRMEAERLGYTSRFTIYDEADSLRMLKRCLEALEVDTKRYPPRAVRARISEAKNQLIDAESYQETAGGPFEEMIGQAYRLYERRMLDANSMDFDDLLMRTVNVLELFEDVRRRYRERFRWVLVDEYQDTNHAQYRLLQLLCGEDGNLTVVGDDSQSIYGFRRAEVRNILEFEDDFPRCARRQARAELPVHRDDPRCGQRGHLPQHRPSRQEALVRPRGGREDPSRRARGRARRGEVRRRRDRGADRPARAEPRRDRGLLPDQRPQPGARGHPRPLRAPLPGDRRDEVLRAGGDQGCNRLPAAAGESGRRGELLAGDQLAAPRDRRHQPGPDPQPREHHRADDLGGRPRAGSRPGLAAAAIKSISRFTELIEELRAEFESGPWPTC